MAKKNKSPLNRKDLLNGIQKTKIKAVNLSFWEIIILISLLIISTSLLNPWFSLEYNQSSYWAFSKITGIVWYLSLIFIAINIFTIFSLSLKQKIKIFFNIFIEDSSLFLFSSLTLFILWVNTAVTLWWLQLFSSEIQFHSWIILYLLWSILFLFWAVLYKKTKKISGDAFLTNNSDNSSFNNTKKQKNTTKLPF